MIIFETTRNPNSQRQTIDLLFKNNRICKHKTNFKTPHHPLRVDFINVWFLKWLQVKPVPTFCVVPVSCY